MDYLAEIKAEVRKGSPCGTGPLIASLDEDIQQAIHEAHARGLPATAISAWLAKREIDISGSNLRYHLGGRCKCQR